MVIKYPGSIYGVELSSRLVAHWSMIKIEVILYYMLGADGEHGDCGGDKCEMHSV